MLAKKYRSEIISIENPFEGIYTLEFRPERGKYKFLPGQFLHLAIDSEYDGTDQWPESRCFSMQSPPGGDTIKITYAVKGAYTSEMQHSLKTGSRVWLKLPYGDLFQQGHSKEKTVFIAGGTGVTPYLSLFNHASFKEYSNPKAYLGLRSDSYNIYTNDLDNACNSELKTQIIYQDKDGLLDIESIFNENGSNSSYFISGPPEMIKNFKSSLINRGVPTLNIFTDDWE